ncbi:hypothetical protein MKW92_015771, partial [Papaver armeniacum]
MSINSPIETGSSLGSNSEEVNQNVTNDLMIEQYGSFIVSDVIENIISSPVPLPNPGSNELNTVVAAENTKDTDNKGKGIQ